MFKYQHLTVPTLTTSEQNHRDLHLVCPAEESACRAFDIGQPLVLLPVSLTAGPQSTFSVKRKQFFTVLLRAIIGTKGAVSRRPIASRPQTIRDDDMTRNNGGSSAGIDVLRANLAATPEVSALAADVISNEFSCVTMQANSMRPMDIS